MFDSQNRDVFLMALAPWSGTSFA
ncbi:protein of unknown function [Paraburkholderia dioscoreae]|uniref:Uncharacterized protein n=1 Tax=Paraburkholderia dioscoreae TaxID=2604047 RepID=A0A5Q4Z2X4_9BURK|nr:protein of unknown function [Paraburkholderia dioscoreae]